MHKILSFCLFLLLASCSSSDNYRELSSSSPDLSGTYLGVAKYKFGRKGPNKAATRIYLHEIKGERGSYHAVLLEYVDLLRMAPQYVVANKLPIASPAVGFLKNITSSISAYKVVPGREEGIYEMWLLKVAGDRIVVSSKSKPRILKLSKADSLKNPLEGATISSVKKGEPQEIFFPMKDDEKVNGVQYTIANLTYSKVKLDSTWRKSFLPGPYLSAYARLDDEVLELTGSRNAPTAIFKLNPAKAEMSAKKRQRMFTNTKSAFLKGEFAVTEPIDGMFLFSSVSSDAKSNNEVKGRIGLFIDIFDATKALNQDVVELALIDPENPEDFLMYYEHPDNGNGENH